MLNFIALSFREVNNAIANGDACNEYLTMKQPVLLAEKTRNNVFWAEMPRNLIF